MYSASDNQTLDSVDGQLTQACPSPLWKRSVDLIGCVVSIPILAVITIVMTVVMKIVSPGPVFFIQERVGYRGRLFNLYKFRTMRLNTDPNIHRNHVKSLVDSRSPLEKFESKSSSCLIPGGWLLRASGLDELPQLINVFRGEMSLVGPRPCLPYEFEMYQPWQLKRFETPPGLTGLWQVSGKNRTTFDQMIRMDIQYATSKTLAMDVKIILKTIPALVVQVYDTKIGRRSSAITAHTAIPFPVPAKSETLEEKTS